MIPVRWTPDLSARFSGIGLNKQPKTFSEVRGSETTPINVKLQQDTKESFSRPKFLPRRYQVELYHEALKDNVLIYLGTGLGKTFIVVMLLNSPMIDSHIRQGRKVVFMAPTQDLVKQQAEYVSNKVPYLAKVYCGVTCNAGLHIDHWSQDSWTSELERIDVFFMTPAIFNHALSTNILSWNSFSLVIFDEAHHAATSKKEKSGKKAGSQYSQILNNYQEMHATKAVDQPRLVGLTASLVNNMPSNRDSIRQGISELEHKFSAKCITDLSSNDTKPQMLIVTYNKSELTRGNDTLLRIMYEYSERMDNAVEANKSVRLVGPMTDDEKRYLAYQNRLKLASTGFSIKPKSLSKVLKQLAAIRANTGLWTLANICHNLFVALDRHRTSSVLSEEIRPLYSEFAAMMQKIVIAINDFLGPENEDLLLTYSQPKLLCLLQVLSQEYKRVQNNSDVKKTFACIVFVKSRVEVVAVCSWLRMVGKLIPNYEFIKVDYAIGMAATMTSKWSCITKRKSVEQSAMLNDFKLGRLNIIVTTSVLEEGIDLPVCSTVIRYDKAETFRVFVQSRGRARQGASSYITICESDMRLETKVQLDKFGDFEHCVKDALEKNDCSIQQTKLQPPTCPDSSNHHRDFFKDEEKGILITPETARIILAMYLRRMTGRCPYSDGLTFERSRSESDTIQTTLHFPHGFPVKGGVTGQRRDSVQAADASAIIAAYVALYKSGELDHHGVPIRATEEAIDELLARHKLGPDFSQLSREQEGEKIQVGEKEVHSYISKMCYLSTRFHALEHFKLYRIIFTARESGRVRRETREFFETSVFGLVVDVSQDHHQWPKQISSHYGDFSICYNLLDDKLNLSNHSLKCNCLNYTFHLISTFWNLRGFRKDEFRRYCAFYLVPLSRDDRIDEHRLANTSNMSRSELRPEEIVKLNRYYTHRNDTRRFMIKKVHFDMDAHSKIPLGRGETFLERCQRLQLSISNARQPVVEVIPISSQFARVSAGKNIKPNHETQPIYFLAEFLDRLNYGPEEAFQAYNLPETIYCIYLTKLASELEAKFLKATEFHRRHQVIPPRLDTTTDVGEELEQIGENEEEEESSDPSNLEPDAPAFNLIESEDEEEDEGEAGVRSSDESDSSDPDEPSPADKQLEILGKQVFKLKERNESEMERWNMDSYEANDLRAAPIEFEEFRHAQKYTDTSPRGAAFISLRQDTLCHQVRIEEILKQVERGIISDANYSGEDKDYSRPGFTVDLSIAPPFKIDANFNPPKHISRVYSFLNALTQKRASESNNLEVLENIGDSFLKYITSVVLFRRLDSNEGMLTLTRARLVSNKHLAHLAKKSNLGSYVVSKKFDPELLASIFALNCKTLSREKDLADTFEALVGASFLFGGHYEAILALKWLGLGQLFDSDDFAIFHQNSVVFSKFAPALIDLNNEVNRHHLSQSAKRLRRVEAILNYEFSDPSYLVQAFTHGSAPNRCTETYERLEFLGDAILDFLITWTLHERVDSKSPDQLSSSRSALVNNYTFARLAIKYKFDIYILHANQQLFEELSLLNERVKSDPDMDHLDVVDYDRITKVLADVFESVAGAIFVDSGGSLDAVYRIFYPMMKESIDREIEEPTKNIVRQLYELFPGKDRVKFEFYNLEGSENAELITSAKCSVYGLGDFFGEGSSKRQAKRRAVTNLMSNLPTDEAKAELDKQYAIRTSVESASGGGYSKRGGRGRRPYSRAR